MCFTHCILRGWTSTHCVALRGPDHIFVALLACHIVTVTAGNLLLVFVLGLLLGVGIMNVTFLLTGSHTTRLEDDADLLREDTVSAARLRGQQRRGVALQEDFL
jgi:hypothetical protein